MDAERAAAATQRRDLEAARGEAAACQAQLVASGEELQAASERRRAAEALAERLKSVGRAEVDRLRGEVEAVRRDATRRDLT